MATVAAGNSQSITASGSQSVEISLAGGGSGYITVNGTRTDLTTGNRTVRLKDQDVLVIVCYSGIVNYTVSGGSTTAGAGTARALFATKTLASTDDGKVYEVATNQTATVVPTAGDVLFDILSGATLTISFSGGATGNGSASTVTRVGPQLVSVLKRVTGSPNDRTVTGS